MLYELAVHPEHQSIIRAELKQSSDYDSMPFFNAAIKVSTFNGYMVYLCSPLVTGDFPSISTWAFIDTYGSS